MKKSTLFISFDGLSDPLGQSQILPYLCGIAANGYQINILSCEKKERFLKEHIKIQDRIKTLPITWQHIDYKENGGFLLRMVYILKLYILSKKLCQQQSIRIIHCRSYLAALIGLSLKIRLNIPFLFDMRGFWADERIDGAIWNKNNFIHKRFFNFFKRKEKRFLEKSDAVVSLTNAGVQELASLFPHYHLLEKTTVIPCCTNTNLFKLNANSTALKELGLSPIDEVIIYTGSIGTWYYTKEMIDCMLIWKKFKPNLKFLILTRDQVELATILSKYTEAEKSIVLSKAVSYTEVVNYLSIAKAALFFIKPSYSKIASSPTKMAECWSLDLPIITNTGIGDNDLFFKQHQGGILLSAFNNEAYERAYQDYLALKQEANHYRQIALNYFDLDMAIKKYSDIYQQLSAD